MRDLLVSLWTLYNVNKASNVFVYMLQNVEYRPWPYLVWFWQTERFGTVMHRRSLDKTKAARLLKLGAFVGMCTQLIIGIGFIWVGLQSDVTGGVWFGAAFIISYPLVWAHVLALVAGAGQLFVLKPREFRQTAEAKEIFAAHPGMRVAIAGSYGKTSMKELLSVVLSEGKKVAATPANMNVLSSHAKFARKLSGDEDVVLVEFGEGKPGDVERFTKVVQPTDAVITGLAPAHLDRYKTVEAAGKDIFSVTTGLSPEHVYVNAESGDTKPFVSAQFGMYDRTYALGWKVENAKTDIKGTSFELVKDKKRLQLKSKLVGLHHVGPLAFAAAFGLKVGLTEAQVKAGMAKTAPFEHRMQPYQLSGAWIIDDTYNGNLEGIKAGTELLAGLKAKRKVYVTPGLVDQGKESATIHHTVGELIATAKPDLVVLMQNSAVEHIRAGLTDAGYTGEVSVQTDPLEFYQNLDHFVAAGDVVLMQNDWTDNYK